jgi:hypothetical protein
MLSAAGAVGLNKQGQCFQRLELSALTVWLVSGLGNCIYIFMYVHQHICFFSAGTEAQVRQKSRQIKPSSQIKPLSQIKPSSQKMIITVVIFFFNKKNNNTLAHAKYQKHQLEKILPQKNHKSAHRKNWSFQKIKIKTTNIK